MNIGKTSSINSLQSLRREPSDNIKKLKSELKQIKNTKTRLEGKLEKLQIQKKEVNSIKIALSRAAAPEPHAAKIKNVYLRHSEKQKLYFSTTKGFAVKFGLSQGGFQTAKKNFEGVISENIFGSAHTKVNSADLSNRLNLQSSNIDLEIHNTISTITGTRAIIASKKTELSEEKTKLRSIEDTFRGITRESSTARINTTNTQTQFSQHNAIAKIYGSNIGARYLNFLERQKSNTWIGDKPAKPTFNEVANFYDRSSKGSDCIGLGASDKIGVNEVLKLHDSELLNLMRQAVKDSIRPGASNSPIEFHRGARLTEVEFYKFANAKNTNKLVANSFFMSASPDIKEAKRFLQKEMHASPDRTIPVIFTLLGEAGNINNTYEQDFIFLPGTKFEVLLTANSGGVHRITLSERNPSEAKQFKSELVVF